MPTTLRDLSFGIEIEAVVTPWKIRPGWTARQYHQRLQAALTNRELLATVNTSGSNLTRLEPYDKWFITNDGSLRVTEPEISMEAVSPKMSLTSNYEFQIKKFWEAARVVFKVQENKTAGTHVHIGSMGRSFNLEDAKIIAFATCIHEPYVFSLLPKERRDYEYCRRNSVQASRMGELVRQHTPAALKTIANEIGAFTDLDLLVTYMQGDSRRVLWNFQNLVRAKDNGQPTYTIEFRGGRHMRGHRRTLAWAAFAVAFIAMALDENLINSHGPYKASHSKLAQDVIPFWTKLHGYAGRLRMEGHLPRSFKMMNESESWNDG